MAPEDQSMPAISEDTDSIAASDERLMGEEATHEELKTVDLEERMASEIARGMASGGRSQNDLESADGHHSSNDKSSLLNAGDGEGGSTLINWNMRSHQIEAVLLSAVVLLLFLALSGGCWLLGTNAELRSVRVGLSAAYVRAEQEEAKAEGSPGPEQEQRFTLSNACANDLNDADGGAPIVSCMLYAAGASGIGLAITSMALALLLLAHAVLTELHIRGRLKPFLEKLPPDLSEEKLAMVLREGPLVAWGLLLLFEYLTLFVYAIKVPETLGAGGVAFGYSYGLVRLAMVVSAAAAASYLALARGMGEVLVTEVLDGLKAATACADRKSAVLQGLMLLGLLCEVLLWVERPGWGGLLQLYGLWSVQCKLEMAMYSCASLVAVGMDALSIVTPTLPPPPVTMMMVLWVLVIDRVAILGALRFYRLAFV
uniref:Uncharacterized protein n=1 Tax=Chrysotila carterae TaxID=13221 RepID=A0A7S4BCR8_CHRCT|mmetsp:Transcript_2941/g.6203  ORF Transcript_2941/g.6203 Transcript_2941/m.6203 type:complete len:428 (+) Transcript_2941:310-1593(+)